MKTTPFHDRLKPLNGTHLWEHWSGYLSAVKYQHSATFEYFAIRNSAALFDTSPLFKYRISGPDAASFLGGVMTRDPETCAVGHGLYTAWCDDDGFVREDGVILRTGADEFWLAAAKPNLDYLARAAGCRQVVVDDVSARFGILALQGPLSTDVLAAAGVDVAALPYFGVTSAALAGRRIMISRTGFTGDLGYEIWVEAPDAIRVFDAIVGSGVDFNLVPIGSRALTMARLEAGMLLIDVDFSSVRHAWTPADRETPDELGLGWMVPSSESRPFVGAAAIARERELETTRWRTVGIQADPGAYEGMFNSRGLIAPKHGVYVDTSQSLYDRDFDAEPGGQYVGYVTSFMFSPLLKRHIGIAKVPFDRAGAGSEVYLERSVLHRPAYVKCHVVPMPMFNPPRKTALLALETS